MTMTEQSETQPDPQPQTEPPQTQPAEQSETQPDPVTIDVSKWGHLHVPVRVGEAEVPRSLPELVESHMLRSDYDNRVAALEQQRAEQEEAIAVGNRVLNDPQGAYGVLARRYGPAPQPGSAPPAASADPYDPYSTSAEQPPQPQPASPPAAELEELRQHVARLAATMTRQEQAQAFEQFRTAEAIPADISFEDVAAHAQARGIADLRVAARDMTHGRLVELSRLQQRTADATSGDAALLGAFDDGSASSAPPPPQTAPPVNEGLSAAVTPRRPPRGGAPPTRDEMRAQLMRDLGL